MAGIKLSQLQQLTSLNANDTNILILATSENGPYNSVTFSLNTLYNSLYDAVNSEAAIAQQAYNQSNLALIATQTSNTFLQANDVLTLSTSKFYTDSSNTWLQANDVLTLSSALSYANANFLSISGGTITGNLSITGNVSPNKIIINGTSSDIYDLDDISFASDGYRNTYTLSYNQQTVSVSSPYLLHISVNGLFQPAFDYKYDTFWLSNVLASSKGYCLDNSGNLKFSSSTPIGSQIVIRTVLGSMNNNKKVYPFKPLDILMGY